MNLKKSADVRVPATTANLGPGFDCLGMALDIWNTVRIERGGHGMTVIGEGADRLNRNENNLIHRSALALFQHIGEQAPQMGIICHNAIPLSRGLGSSSAAIVGGLVAANALADSPLSQTELLKLATEIEGHPDNVTPALLGGCQIVVKDSEKLVTSSVALPDGLHAVLFIPNMPMATAKARAVLPPTYSREDAVFNIGRSSLLVNALATGNLELLRTATQDKLHQPQRMIIFPQMRLFFRAALNGGAYGAFLSGAGSTILAFARGNEMTVSYEMADEAYKTGIEGQLMVTQPVAQGATVTSVE